MDWSFIKVILLFDITIGFAIVFSILGAAENKQKYFMASLVSCIIGMLTIKFL